MSAAHDWRDATITELFAYQVRCRPDATALRFRDQEMSYAQLDDRADRLACRLRMLGVGTESVVGVCVERSFEMVIALLGILKAGGAYLPLHPDEPAPRFRYMLEWAHAEVLLTHEQLIDRLPKVGAAVLSLDREELPSVTASVVPDTTADTMAYVCYTSGSTGEPKGVSVSHRGVTRLIQGDYTHFGSDETFLQLCSLTFDPATFEIWGALLNGGRLVIYRPGTLTLSELADCIEHDKVTTLWLTTGLFHRMVDSQLESLSGVRQLLAGGDVLSPAHMNRVRRAYPEMRLINGYGPTENTTFTSCHTVTDLVGERVPIGVPITGTHVYVLDERLQPVLNGEWGELYAGGAGLARGYLGRPAFTAERFLADPLRPGERMYRIGDIARRDGDGVLDFRGRSDHQVKIGGYRVEPGEIEAVLAGHPRVKEVVVVPREDVSAGEKILVAYVVPEGGDENLLAELRLALHQRLPRHMMPAVIIAMESFPLTRNEKVNRAALPSPERIPRDVDTAFGAPRTSVEALLADLWADALTVTEVGVHDDFFELGGNSLLAADLLARIRDTLAVDVPAARLFFENATVAGLAEIVDRGAGQPNDDQDSVPATQRRHNQ